VGYYRIQNVCTKLNAAGEVRGGDTKESLKSSRKRDAPVN